MTLLVFTMLVFLGVGVFFLFFHLLLGKMIRPAKPEAEKLTIYECGEPTVGSAWIQFDLRYYVVALLFVVFDVEVAFFFPWAVVFGQTNELSRSDLTVERRQELTAGLNSTILKPIPGEDAELPIPPAVAKSFARLALVDIAVFFGVLMMGFAYLWRRGDIDWVRATTHSPEQTAIPERGPPQLAAAGSDAR